MHEMNFQFIFGVEKAFSFACQMRVVSNNGSDTNEVAI